MNHPSYTRAPLVMTSGEAFDRTVVRYSMRELMLAELEPGAE